MRSRLVQNLRADVQPARRWTSSFWLAVVVGSVYALSAKMSLGLLTPEGVAEFWPAAGVAAGGVVALGGGGRWGGGGGAVVGGARGPPVGGGDHRGQSDGRSKPFELRGFRGLQCRRSPADGRPDRTLFRLALQSRSAAPRARLARSSDRRNRRLRGRRDPWICPIP